VMRPPVGPMGVPTRPPMTGIGPPAAPMGIPGGTVAPRAPIPGPMGPMGPLGPRRY
jgi:hypothetical protein